MMLLTDPYELLVFESEDRVSTYVLSLDADRYVFVEQKELKSGQG